MTFECYCDRLETFEFISSDFEGVLRGEKICFYFIFIFVIKYLPN